jgi:hypothetical protein
MKPLSPLQLMQPMQPMSVIQFRVIAGVIRCALGAVVENVGVVGIANAPVCMTHPTRLLSEFGCDFKIYLVSV